MDKDLIEKKILRGFNLLEGKEVPNFLTSKTYFSARETAEFEFVEVLKVDPQNCDALIGLGRCYTFDPQKYDQAISIFEEVIKTHPFEAKAHYFLGLLFLRMGERRFIEGVFEKAIKYFKEAEFLNYTPKTTLYNNLGTTLFRVEKYEDAIFYFEKSAKFSEDEKVWEPSTFSLAAEACEKLKRPQDAMSWYKLSVLPGVGIPAYEKETEKK